MHQYKAPDAAPLSLLDLHGWSQPEAQQPKSAPGDAPGLLDLHGGPLANIWQQLDVDDRKALYRTCSQLRESKELNALLTDCLITVDGDGNSATDLTLHWPRHAPPPRRMRIQYRTADNNGDGLIRHLEHILSEEDTPLLFREVLELQLDWEGKHVKVKPILLAPLLVVLSPSVVRFQLCGHGSNAMLQHLPWPAIQSLRWDKSSRWGLMAADPMDLTSVAHFTKLTSLSITCGDDLLDVAWLSSLTALQSLKLRSGTVGDIFTLTMHGLTRLSQGCTQLTQLEFGGVKLQPALANTQHQNMLTCYWPSLVELQSHNCEAGVLSFLLPTPQAAPQLARIRMDDTPTDWSPELQGASICLTHHSTQDCATGLLLWAADVQCLAAFGCQALCVHFCIFSEEEEVEVQYDLTAILQPLAPTLTHLCLKDIMMQEQFLTPGWGKTVALALPGLCNVFIEGLQTGLEGLVLNASALSILEVSDLSCEEDKVLLLACGLVGASGRKLTVRIFSENFDEVVLLWRHVSGMLPQPVSVTVVDLAGCDVLDYDDEGDDASDS